MNEKNHELKKIVIIGAGGQGKDVLWTIMDINKISSRFDIIGFLDDDKKLHGKTINGVPVLGGMNWLSNKNKMGCIIAVGEGKIREKIVKKLKNVNVYFPSIIHPSVDIFIFIKVLICY